MGSQGTPDHHAQTSELSTNYDPHALVPDLRQGRSHPRNTTWAVVGYRSLLGPTLGVTFDSAEGHMHGTRHGR
jgi:hypothetical protein